MELDQFVAGEDRPVRTTDDGQTIVADLGAGIDEAIVDVVDETAIVVADDDQFDVDLPSSAERAFIRNGVLTIELEDNA